MTLELKKFNMRDISFKPDENKGPVVVLIGRRDTGKVTWFKICYFIIKTFQSAL